MIAFYKQAQIEIPKFDFRLPGVTSISADAHKYGLCPKGVSILLYSNKDYRKYQYSIYPFWMGGPYPSPTLEGSRSPAFVVAAYAVMLHLGKNRYISQAKLIHEAVKRMAKFVKDEFEHDHLNIIGDPFICAIAFKGSKSMILFDQMTRKGWHINMVNNPIGFNFVITSANLANMDTFMSDLRTAYQYVINFFYII